MLSGSCWVALVDKHCSIRTFESFYFSVKCVYIIYTIGQIIKKVV